MSSGLLAVSFGTMDQGIDNLKRNLLVERLSGDHLVDPWVPVIQPGLRVRHKAAAIGSLPFEFSEPRQKP